MNNSVQDIKETPTANLTFVVGFMGSGKTTWGRKLAQVAGHQFIDLDHLIVDKIGMDIPQFFKSRGETEFRLLEAETLRTIPKDIPTIVATGGGTPCYHNSMEWMNEHGNTIYFKLSPLQLWQRLNKPKHIESRPALRGLTEGELLEFITAKLNEREPFYSQAKLIVDQSAIELAELAQQIARPPRHPSNNL